MLNGNPLFEDDTPKVWPYGPVFPIVNKRINIDEVINGFPQDIINEFNKHRQVLDIIKSAVDVMYNKSAITLTRWSHQEGSPWYRTLYIKDDHGNIIKQEKWNTPISLEFIKEYFSNPQNRISQ